MGNCQAAEAATVLIQLPGGKMQRMYWAVAASEVMGANPGHYVAVVLTAPPRAAAAGNGPSTPVRHLKLLRPDDILRVGHVYRLISFEGPHFASPPPPELISRWLMFLTSSLVSIFSEVLKELASKNHAKLSKLRLAQEQGQEKKKEKDMEKVTDGGRGRRRVPFSAETGERSCHSPQPDGSPATVSAHESPAVHPALLTPRKIWIALRKIASSLCSSFCRS